MGKDTQISPAVAGVVIAIIVVVVGFFIWRATGKHTVTVQNQDQMREAVSKAMGAGSRPANTPGTGMGAGMPGGPSSSGGPPSGATASGGATNP